MSEVLPPALGDVSPDRQFLWDGTQWKPITGNRWIPTDWTRPMQLAAGAYLALAGLYSIVSVLVFASVFRDAILKQAQKNPSLTSDQVNQAVSIGIGVATGVAVFLGVIYLALAVASVARRWTWVFYVDLVLFLLGAIGIVSSLTSIADPAASGQPQAAIYIGLVFGIAAVGLFAWLLIARIQRGVWACRKAPVAN
ncbi:MAG: hypothetical protein NVS9B1_23980 [Candidatus Dormibacteraceae bacterium]